MVVIKTPGRVDVRTPVLIERSGELIIDVTTPPRLDQVAPGFVYIPPGEFLYGSANEEDRLTFFNTTPLRKRSTRAFLIGRTEVTFGDWMAYVDALPPERRAVGIPVTPARLFGSVIVIMPDGAGHWRIELRYESRRYEAGWNQPIVIPGRSRRSIQDWRRFPVTGISATDAAEYADWLDRTGRVPGARLCSEVEWERAARGADGRTYPSGHVLEPDDANIDATYGSELTGLDEVGSHPASRSPFGLDDMSGNAFEWTLGEGGGYVVRSGGCLNDRKTSNLTNRNAASQTWRDATLGLRLCATPPLP